MARTAKKATTKKSKPKAKASAKTAPAKVASAKVDKKTSTGAAVTKRRLFNFNIFAAVANLIFAVLSVIFVSRQTVDITTAFATKNDIAASGSVLGPAYKTLATVEIRYLLAGIFVISAIFALLLATRLRKNYEDGVANSSSLVRWIFSGISLGLVLAFTTLVGGIGDIAVLILVGGLIFTTCILAWMNERDNKAAKKNYGAFVLSMFTGIIAWLPLAGSLKGTYVYGNTSFDWYVYTLAILILVGFLNFAWNQYKHAKNGISAKGYLQLEGTYLSTDFLIKLVLFAALLLALHK